MTAPLLAVVGLRWAAWPHALRCSNPIVLRIFLVTVTGVDCPNFAAQAGKLGICKRCSRGVGEHAVGKKLMLSKQGDLVG